MIREDDKNWCYGTLREVPFYFDGITPEQYDKEREYWIKNWEQYKRGEYVPLWKQEKESK